MFTTNYNVKVARIANVHLTVKIIVMIVMRWDPGFSTVRNVKICSDLYFCILPLPVALCHIICNCLLTCLFVAILSKVLSFFCYCLSKRAQIVNPEPSSLLIIYLTFIQKKQFVCFPILRGWAPGQEKRYPSDHRSCHH